MMKKELVNFKSLNPLATIPHRATDYAGGWDVTATEIVQKDEDFVVCKLGFACALPIGYKLTLVPRSSITNTKWVMQNSPGLGDSDFRGEYQIRFRAFPESIELNEKNQYPVLKYPEFPYKVGDRIGQVYLEEVVDILWAIEEGELPATNRPSEGYGSTGK